MLNSKEALKKAIFELSCLDGTSGNEKAAGDIAALMLRNYMPVRIDTLGNVRGEQEGSGVHILLDAHIDRIGMVVTAIEENGFVKFTRCGGLDARVLAAEEVTIWGREPVYGVITSTPPHLSTDDGKKARAFEDLSIDTGINTEKLKAIVSPGDRVTVNAKPLNLMGDRISCAALDDRCGVVAVLRCLDILKEKKHNCKLSVVFAVQEETTGSGAATGAFDAKADEAIAVDVSFATAPGLKKEECGVMGKGAMIGISPTLDYNMSREFEELAKRYNIPYQFEVMDGSTGTDADEIQIAGHGAKMGLISIPQRNMHTAAEVIDLNDIEAVAQLMAAYIMERGAENV